MLQQIFKPSELLIPYINYYCVVETFESYEYSPYQRIYPYGNTILVFHYGKPSRISFRDKLPLLEPQTVICGQQTSYYDLALSGETGMIFVVFSPYGANTLSNIPNTEFTNQNIDFKFIAKEEVSELEDKIYDAKTTKERIQIVEGYMIKRVAQNWKSCAQMDLACNLIKFHKAQITIKQLANECCLSIKQFERRFSDSIGLNPKQYLRIIRFQNVLQSKKNADFKNYASLAYDCGFYDQSHLVNDFKLITGLTPKFFFDSIEKNT